VKSKRKISIIYFKKNLRSDSSQHSAKSSTSSNKKTNDNGLCVLGYENVKSAPVHPKVRQELDYLDREVRSFIYLSIFENIFCSYFRNFFMLLLINLIYSKNVIHV